MPLPLLLALLFGSGLLSGSVIIAFAWAKESTPAHLAGTTVGVANTGNMLGGTIMRVSLPVVEVGRPEPVELEPEPLPRA